MAEEGWKLLSTEYKNLDTELEMECPKGHKQTWTYRQWRKHQQCETCMAGDPFKGKKNSVPTKIIGTYRILALDAATNITGYSVYDNGELVGFGTYKTNDKNDVTERINEMKHWLEAALRNWQIDFCGIEHVQLQTYGNNGQQVELYRKLCNLQGIVLDTCFEAKVPWELAYASQWRKYCNVGEGASGRENKKKLAQEKVKLWYNQDCTQDEADAICIGKYFVGKLNTKKSTWGESFD